MQAGWLRCLAVSFFGRHVSGLYRVSVSVMSAFLFALQSCWNRKFVAVALGDDTFCGLFRLPYPLPGLCALRLWIQHDGKCHHRASQLCGLAGMVLVAEARLCVALCSSGGCPQPSAAARAGRLPSVALCAGRPRTLAPGHSTSHPVVVQVPDRRQPLRAAQRQGQ